MQGPHWYFDSTRTGFEGILTQRVQRLLLQMGLLQTGLCVVGFSAPQRGETAQRKCGARSTHCRIPLFGSPCEGRGVVISGWFAPLGIAALTTGQTSAPSSDPRAGMQAPRPTQAAARTQGLVHAPDRRNRPLAAGLLEEPRVVELGEIPPDLAAKR